MNNTIVLETRNPTIDVVRGVAILGTLWTNIWLFTNIHGLYGALMSNDDQPLAERILISLSQGKFLALLSLIFGVGLSLQLGSARRKAVRWPGRYRIRMLLLLADGTINYFLIAEFDVLMGYAVTGWVVSYLLLTRTRTQTALIITLGLVHTIFIGLIASAGSTFSEPADELITPYANGSFVDLVLFRLDNFGLFRAEPVLIFALSLALFLAGAKLNDAGVFRPEASKLRSILMIIGATALPIDLALGISGNTSAILVQRYLTAPLVSLGLLAGIIWLCLHFGTPQLLQKVGQTALSCYLLQNLLAGALFYGWGLGLVNHIQPWRVPATMLGYVVVMAAVVLFAHLWLNRFSIGPVEWVWKKLAQPLKR